MGLQDSVRGHVTPLRALIVEDEPVAARRLKRILQTQFRGRFSSVETERDVEGALEALEGSRFDLILLDLDLDGRDGFSLLDRVACAFALTIIVSAHEQLALRAFEYGVVDFVAKPYTPARLERALQRLEARRPPEETPAHRYLGIKDRAGIRVVDVASIEHIAAAGDYAELTLSSGETLLHARALDALTITLPPSFERVHRSHIVNLDCVVRLTSTSGGRYRLALASGNEVPVGRSRYAAVKAKLADREGELEP